MKLEITAERVKEAAKGCPDAKNVLQKLFPEVFEKEKGVKVNDFTYVTKSKDWEPAWSLKDGDSRVLEPRTGGNFHEKALYLNTAVYKYEIVTDSTGQKVLLISHK